MYCKMQTLAYKKISTHLPHGLNTLLEEVEVTVAGQVAWSDHVTIETPELLHLVKEMKCLYQQLTQHKIWAVSGYKLPIYCMASLKRSQGSTYRGKAANLFNVLLVALSAGRSPRGASGVPEGVVVLKRVLSCPGHHHLQKTTQ